MQRLTRLIYISVARDGLQASELQAIFESCRRNNPAREISGMLCRVDDLFFHVIEGEDERVLDLYQILRADSRHIDLCLLQLATVEKRLFERFMMGEFVRRAGAMIDYLELAGWRRKLGAGNPMELVREFMGRVQPAQR
jgi:hypothetical protein